MFGNCCVIGDLRATLYGSNHNHNHNNNCDRAIIPLLFSAGLSCIASIVLCLHPIPKYPYIYTTSISCMVSSYLLTCCCAAGCFDESSCWNSAGATTPDEGGSSVIAMV